MAGGHFYLGGGTAVQQATGVEDSAEEMFKYLMAVSLDPDEEKIRAFCEDSVEHFDWIEALGMEFERSLYEKKAVIQPGTEGLMFTGNEKVHPFRDLAKPAPRGHKVPEARRHRRRQDGARRAGRADRRDRRRRALRDRRGQPGGRGRTRGRRRSRRRRLAEVRRARLHPREGGRRSPPVATSATTRWSRSTPPSSARSCSRSPPPTTTASASGWAHRPVRELRFMEQAFITAPFYPPAQLVTGIVVNKEGKRFVAEDSYHSRTSGLRDGPARPGGVPDRRLRPHRAPRLPAVPVHRRLGDRRGDGAGARHPRRRAARPRCRRTTRTRRARRTPSSTSTPTGSSRRTPARGVPTT